MRTAISGLLLAAVTLAGCSAGLPLDEFSHDGVVWRKVVHAPEVTRQGGPHCGGQPLETVKGASGGPASSYSPPLSYEVGPGDVLRLNVFGEEGMRDMTARVDNEGFIQLPIIELVRVGGMNTREIQAHLKVLYRDFFNDPWITVELANAESQPLYLLGEFRSAGTKYLQRPTNVVEAVSMGAGLEEDAYLPGARLLRGNTICTVDLHALLRQGDFSQNVYVAPRDAIFAPQKEDLSVYVLGAVGGPQAVPFGLDGRAMLEAISMAGGFEEAGARVTEVRIVRTLSPTSGELIIVDVRAVLEGRALDFPLEPGDVIYIPQSPVADWNDALGKILGTLNFIGGVLTPIALIQSIQTTASGG